jgi:hypothetical protein
MRQAAQEKLDRFVLATNYFKPRFCVPMASFSWFCNNDNRSQNSGILPIRNIIAELRNRVSAKVILLKPGDRWDMISGLNLDETIDRYEAAEKQLDSAVYVQSSSVDLMEIFGLARKCRRRALVQNDRMMIFLNELLMVPPMAGVNIYVEDHDTILNFSMTRGLRPRLNGGHVDVELRSDCLAWLFQFDFGFDTLFASGRFKLRSKNAKRLFRTFSAPILNNMGKSLSGRLLLDKNLIFRAVEMLRFLGRKTARAPTSG